MAAFKEAGLKSVLGGHALTEGDVERRLGHIHRLQQIAQRDLPSLTLLELHPFRVFSARLRGVNVNPDGALQSLKAVAFDA